ncbi:MarR family winged helix-turn-helix transcriptional regulator [Nocardioides sp. SYSU DS0663]|uniref:MarR family winged helix-turn-helix transcriptional regulator n=1 Tax=Nocardioides sp. SYSU DS0663 TaxID=3416445 RepID=UPI003F4B166D
MDRTEDRVEDLVHEALTEYAAQADAYLARAAHRLSPGLGRQPLVVLFRLKRYGPLREGDVAAQLQLPPSEVARHVDDLAARGLVSRLGVGPHATVCLTDATAGALDLAEDERRGRILDGLEAWSLEEKESLARLLAKFVQRDDLVVRARSLPARR